MELNSIADALTGLQANQSYMDVVGNNISNVNTTAYKTQSIRFQDLMNQTMSLGTAANGGLEPTNPLQVGMGVGTEVVNQINSQGSVQTTGRLTDMSIQGAGYFVVSNGQQNQYTRDGSLTVAPDGTLENASTGMTVQGWMGLNAAGGVNTATPTTTVKIPVGSQTAAATTAVALAGNLNSAQPPSTPVTSTINVYDSQGNAHSLNLTLNQTAANQWSWSVAGGADVKTLTGGSGNLTFNPNGVLSSPTTPPTISLTYTNNTAAGSVSLDFSKVSQLAQASQINVGTSDGAPGGSVSTFSVGKDGTITAVYTNGISKTIGQIALANFANPDGLIRQGNNLNASSVSSGPPQIGTGGVGTLGTISTGQLEGSNVDLAAQFGQMIQAQQGYNASTKVISTTDTLMQSLMAMVP